MSETEEKQEKQEENQELSINNAESDIDSATPVKEKVWSKFGDDDEEPVAEICNRLLNIFRQMHVLSESGIERFNQDLKTVNEDVRFEFYGLPGGLEIIDYITFLQTGEKINSRRLRARQKQEEELGVDVNKLQTQSKSQPLVQQQPVIQYVPMPSLGGEDGGDGNNAIASMQAMMTQFVSMQQNSGGASFSSSELANVLSENQKNILNNQAKSFIESQKSIATSQTKAFIEGQKSLAELQNKFAADAQKQMMQVQEKFLADTKETLERTQKILFAMQKDSLEQVTTKMESIALKIGENATPSIDYNSLLEIQEKTAKLQVDVLKEAGKENLLAFERIIQGIKGNSAGLSHFENNGEYESVQSFNKEEDVALEFEYDRNEEFIKKGREKRKERMMKKRIEANNEDTFEIKEASPSNTVFVSISDEEKGIQNDDENLQDDVSSDEHEDINKQENVENLQDTLDVQEVQDINDEPMEEPMEEMTSLEQEEEIKQNNNETILEMASENQYNEEKIQKENYIESEEGETTVSISDFDDAPPPPSFNGENTEENTEENEPPLDEEEVAPEIKENFYNREDVEKIKPESEAFIPQQALANNFPQPGVLTAAQVIRKEGNIGFAINEGSYKTSSKKDPAEAVRNYEEDPFAKKISPKAASRFKSKRNEKPENEKEKSIFSVFKKFVGNDKKGDQGNNQPTLDEDI